MARRRRTEEPENHERWLVSYADFITLLFAFFVVMYALSSVNEGKYRILSDSLDAAFRGSNRSLRPVQVGELVRSAANYPVPPVDGSRMIDLGSVFKFHPQALLQPGMDSMARQIEHAFSALIDEGIVEVRRNGLWLEVEINTSILFPSGSTRLSPEAVPMLHELAKILRRFPNQIHVEGYTDNIPIRTKTFPSNWELSAGRSARVVRIFAQYGIAGSRMVAIGHGENRPKAGNNTEAGRNKNRRVVVNILAEPKGRPGRLAHRIPDTLLKDLGPVLQTAATEGQGD
jgi:chemotaxis protein MotB